MKYTIAACLLLLINPISFAHLSLSAGQTPETTTALINYFESGKYIKDFENSIREGKSYLSNRIKRDRKRPLAIVIDVDETAVIKLSHHQTSIFLTKFRSRCSCLYAR